MQIVVEPAPGQRYKGSLFIDDELIEMTLQSRPGCCVRTLMNKIMLLHGKPTEKITLDIEGW
jgi:hypothetical protein